MSDADTEIEPKRVARRRAWKGAVQGRSEQFELKRQVVLRTAAKTFSQRGFHQTTLSEIGRASCRERV